MSQRKSPYPTPVPTDRNYLLLCQQMPKSQTKIRSGIIERYTYKKGTESGLKTPNANAYYKKHACGSKSSDCATPFVPSNVSCASGSSSGIVRPILMNHDSQVLKSYDRPFLRSPRASPVVINGNSSNSKDENEKVRTEHCDSTTDIIENAFGVPRKLYRTNSTPNHFLKLKSEAAGRRYSSSHISDSDSDCQIIDCNSSNFTDESGKVSQNKVRYLRSSDGSSNQSVKKVAPPLGVLNKQMENPNTKVLSWICKKETETEPEIHVISDDEDDVRDKPVEDHQQQTTYISTITTINGQDNAQLKVKLKPHISIDMSSPSVDNKKNKLIEKVVLGKLTPQVKNSLSFINEKYQKVKSQMNQSTKTEMISTPLKISKPDVLAPKLPQLCSITTLLAREKSPPSTSKLQSPQKINAPMSPESMKSEFYNYLKINTNPSAQKEEIVEKNRRSTRVKNLILQIEKAKEQNSTRENNETEEPEEKKKDIRKKYLKYSKINVSFPSFPTEYNTSIIDFKDFIELYFRKEDISYGIKEKENNMSTQKIRHTKTNKLIVTKSLKHKVMMRPKYKSLQVKNNINKLLKIKKRLKPRVAKMIGCTPHVSDIKIDRLRYKPNRIFRRSPIRNTRKYGKNKSNTRTRIRKSNTHNLMPKRVIREEPQLKVPENLSTQQTTAPEKNVDAPIKRIIEDLQVKQTTSILKKVLEEPYTTSPRKIIPENSQINLTTSSKKIVERKLSVSSSKSTEIKLISPENKLTIREVKSPYDDSKNKVKSRSTTPAPKLIITEVTALLNKESKTFNCNEITITKLSPKKTEIPKLNKAKITIKEIETSDSSKCSTPGNVDPIGQPLLHNILAEKLSVALHKNKNNLPVLKYPQYSLIKLVSDDNKQTAISKKRSTMHAVSLNSIQNLQIQSEKVAEPVEESQSVVKSKRKIIKRRYSDFEGFESSSNKKKSSSETSDNKIVRRSPDFLGFEHDNLSAQRSRMMQNIISNLSIDILVSSTIETPEPMEQLMLEMNIDSVPIENEPCNLQDVISKVSADYLSSQELITPLHEDDSSSNYSNSTSDHEQPFQLEEPIVQELFNTALIEKINPHIIPLNQSIKPRSFHRSLMQAGEVKSKSFFDTTNRSSFFEFSDSDSSMSAPKGLHKKSLTHEIDIYEKNGPVYNSYYINGVLIIVQELLITFWKQTALGNILGAQNMWLPHGNVQRISLERGCINKRSSEMILSSENSVAYIELWTKEHESKYRECPIADIFATIYFHRGHGMPDKKVLQLENIKG